MNASCRPRRPSTSWRMNTTRARTSSSRHSARPCAKSGRRFSMPARQRARAVGEAILLQIDFPTLISSWDTKSNTMTLAEYRKWAEHRIDHLNHAANPRHEHEFHVFERVKLPLGKILIPGAVTHSNVMIEHPEAVADHMERWVRVVGVGNVIFGNDCGFQSTAGNTEIPMTVAWAKLQALGEGAQIASKRLSAYTS